MALAKYSASDAREEPPTVSIAELDADPHVIFRRLRPVTPFIRRSDGSYVAIRARDVEALLSDPRTRQLETELVKSRGVSSGPLFEFFDKTMLLTNGRAHRRRRSPLSRAFGNRVVQELRPLIRAIALEVIESVADRREMDVLADYAELIPGRVVSDILGIPRDDVPRFLVWVKGLSRALSYSYGPEDVPEIQAATGMLEDYVEHLLSERRRKRRGDFLSAFVANMEEQGALSPSEAVVQIMTIVVGGSDTTRGAIVMLASLLMQHPEQWQAVCQDASLIPGAVLEGLRYDSVVGSSPRFTLADLEVDGRVVPKNSMLSLSTLAVLRDPDVYDDPDRFDIRRTDHPLRHPAFGGGVHRCLGELLARAELEESLAVLIARAPGMRLIGEPAKLTGHSGIRRISGMRVGWT